MQEDQLFDLIKSLTPHEKGYIRRMTGDQNYTRLFDAIDAQDVYDEVALRKKLSKERFAKNFSSAKNYLLHVILRQLESYDTSVQREVRSLLSQYGILRTKGLHALSYKLLRRAYEICVKNGLDYQKEEVLLMLHSHAIAYGGHPPWPGGAEAIFEEIRRWSKLNVEASAMRFELHQLKLQTPGLLRSRTPEQTEYFRKKAEQLLERDPAELQSFHIRYQYYQLLTNYFYVCNDIESGMRYANALCDWLLENWKYATAQDTSFITAFYNKALHELMLYDSAMEKTLDVLEKLLMKMKIGNPSSRLLFRRLKLLGAWETCRYEDVLSVAAETIQFIAQNKTRVNYPAEEMLCRLISGCALFALGQLDRAAKEIRTALRDPAEEKAHALASNGRLLLLIIEFERGDRVTLDSQVRSAYRYLLKKQQLHKVEKCVLDFLRYAIRKIHNREETIAGFTKLKQNVEAALADKNEEVSARFFDLVSYLESRIAGKSFAEIHRKNMSLRWKKPL